MFTFTPEHETRQYGKVMTLQGWVNKSVTSSYYDKLLERFKGDKGKNTTSFGQERNALRPRRIVINLLNRKHSHFNENSSRFR